MPCGGLGALDVFGDIVDVSQDCRAEPTRLDGFREAGLLLDAGAHSTDLDIGQGLLATQHEMMGKGRMQILFDLRHKGNGPITGFCLWFADHSQVAGWMCDRPLDVDGMSVEIKVLPLETKNFFGA